MRDLFSTIRYAIRQFRQAPVFTSAAVLTLALGIGGTTAIFTLIHAVMLRSLPVSDPSRLYRVGDGDNCCVEGGPQDRWGMYSFPLFERLKACGLKRHQVLDSALPLSLLDLRVGANLHDKRTLGR